MVRYSEFNEAKPPTPIYTPEQEAAVRKLAEYFQFKILNFDADGSINIIGACKLRSGKVFDKLPVKFGKVTGNFSIEGIKLNTLEGSPKIVDGAFNCSSNELTSLAGAPDSASNFYSSHNNLTSLEGLPQMPVSAYLLSSSNKLTSLEGCPAQLQYLDVNYNKLTSFIGGPKIVSEEFHVINNPLTSLEGLPESIGSILSFTYSPDLPLLRLLRLKCRINIFSSNFSPNADEQSRNVSDIIKKYKGDPSRSNILKCQRELIDAGFEGNAKW